MRPRTACPLRLIPVAAVALLLLVPLAGAQAPGTVRLWLRVDAGPVHLEPDPVDVPNPVLPNPAYDVLLAAGPLLEPLPAALEDAPDGLYLVPDEGAPIQLVAWTQGLEQRRLAPAEYLGENLGDTESPLSVVTVEGEVTPYQFVIQGRALPPAVSFAGYGASVGIRPETQDHVDEMAPALPGVETLSGVPRLYEPQQGSAPLEPTSSASSVAGPVALDTSPPYAVVVAAGALLLLAKLLLPLYHRFKRKTALDNEARKGIYELLRAAPGASAAELSQGSGLHVTTVKYHLDVLRRVGMVGEEVVDGCRRFFSYENGDRMEFLSRALLDEPAARAIYGQIQAKPGMPFIEVAKALGMRKEHVHYHIKKLAKHGLIADKWEGGRRLLFPSVPAGAHGPMPTLAPTPAPAAAPAEVRA